MKSRIKEEKATLKATKIGSVLGNDSWTDFDNSQKLKNDEFGVKKGYKANSTGNDVTMLGRGGGVKKLVYPTLTIFLTLILILPACKAEIVSNIEIDPNQIWIKYGQEVIDNIDVLESNGNANIFLTKQEQEEKFDEEISEVKVSSELTYAKASNSNSNIVEKTTQEVKSLFSGSQIVGIIGMIFSLLTIIVICFTIYKIKTK